LGVRQNESIHQELESHQASKGNPDSQQTLALQLPFRFDVGSLSDRLMCSTPE
jgi:hypothetical protein